VHDATQGCELIFSSSIFSCAVARLSARCADPLLCRFDALFAMLVKQGSSFGTGDPHELHYFAQDGLEGAQDVAPGGYHSTHATSLMRSPSWSNPLKALVWFSIIDETLVLITYA
jgi:hypothetical protein